MIPSPVTHRLAGKVALITGASRGIGAALALGFAHHGASLVLNDLPGMDGADWLAEQINSQGGQAISVLADIADLSTHELLLSAAVTQFGQLDILVNNAAIDKRVPAMDALPEDWDRVLAVDLKAPFFLAQTVGRHMRTRQYGSILNIASIHDERAHRNNSIYTIAKGGLKMLTRNLALEWAEFGIRVNALSPGAILTDMNARILVDPGVMDRVLSQIPLARIGDPSELLGAALLLVSDEGRYITGTTLYVDGGMLL